MSITVPAMKAAFVPGGKPALGGIGM